MTEAQWLACEDPAAMLRYLEVGSPGSVPETTSERKLRLIACAFRRAGKYEVWGPGGYDQWEDDDHVIPPGHAQPLEMAYSFSLPGVAANARPPACAALLREVAGNPFRPVKRPFPPNRLIWTPQMLLCESLTQAACNERKRKCEECAGIGSFAADDYSPAGDCVRCAGTGTINDGTLDPFRLALVADALEEAGSPPDRALTWEERETFACGVCGNRPDENGELEHGRGCYTQSEDGGGSEFVEEATRRVPDELLSHLRSPGPHVRGCWALDLILAKE